METYAKIQDFVSSFFERKSPAKLAGSALLITLFMFYAISIFISTQSKFPENPSPPVAEKPRSESSEGKNDIFIPNIAPRFDYIFIGGPIACFLGIWFMLYIVTKKDNEDVYSEIREKLRGDWDVEYYASIGYEADHQSRHVDCTIGQDFIRKLTMRFDVSSNPFFDPQIGHVVRDVALRDNEDGGFTMFYYINSKRNLTSNIVGLFKEGPIHRGIETETLGIVKFDAPPEKGVVNLMSGKWYDLNGNMMRIIAALKMKEKAGDDFRQIEFDDVPVSKIHFDAGMGQVVFRRRATTAAT